MISVSLELNVAITGPPAYPCPLIKSRIGFAAIATESLSVPNSSSTSLSSVFLVELSKLEFLDFIISLA